MVLIIAKGDQESNLVIQSFGFVGGATLAEIRPSLLVRAAPQALVESNAMQARAPLG
jgi:hypothetical protein